MINAALAGFGLLSILLVLVVLIPRKVKLSKHTPALHDADWDSTKWRWVK